MPNYGAAQPLVEELQHIAGIPQMLINKVTEPVDWLRSMLGMGEPEVPSQAQHMNWKPEPNEEQKQEILRERAQSLGRTK